MLHLLIGTDWTANRAEILRRIAQDVHARRGGRVLMVPELISHETERRLCDAAGDTASRYAEVLSFTRLARRVSEAAGSAGAPCLDGGGRVMAMAAAARQLHGSLKAYAAAETKPEFLAQLLDTVDEFKRCCVLPQDLEAAAQRASGSLAQKLHELSLLQQAYDALCQQGKRDPRDEMNRLLLLLQKGDFGKTHTFYIDGFPDFTRQHMAILEQLLRDAPDVTVSLCCDRPGSSRMAFETAGGTALELRRCAERIGTEIEMIYLPAESVPLAPVRDRLFQGRLAYLPELSGRLLLCRAESRYAECQAAAERILALVHAGCRYRDISVVCTQMGAYRDALSMVFARCRIPVYLSGTEKIAESSVIRTVLCAVSAALGGFEQREVLRYLRSALSPLTMEACDRLENYAVVWGIRGKKWLSDWENHPDGLGAEWTDGARIRLSDLNAARQCAIAPLQRLQLGLRDGKNLAAQTEALYAFLTEIHFSERLDALAQARDAAGDNRGAQILNQLWDILIGALEQLYDVLGSTVWDAESYARLLSLLLLQYDVGTIPPVLDAVTVGPFSAMRCQTARHLIVLGAEDGAFPSHMSAHGVLSEQERISLADLGIPLTGGALNGLQSEYAAIYGVFCGARESAAVFCPASAEPSYLYRRLCVLAGGETQAVMQACAAQADPLEAGAYLARWQAASLAAELGVKESYDATRARVEYVRGGVDPAHIRALYGAILPLSASKIDMQAKCRLSYFLTYGIRVRERKPYTVDPAEFGTYVHAVLEQTCRTVMARGGFHVVSEEETWQIAQLAAQSYAQARFSALDSERTAYLFQRNSRELELVVRELWRELAASQFEPAGFEVGFQDGGEIAPIMLRGKRAEAQLRGYVDRVDVWQGENARYFRVVDYKTGKKSVDYCDLFHGIGLQMLLYLFVLERTGASVVGEGALPAGVQYFPARVPVINDSGTKPGKAEADRAKAWQRKGLLLKDETVLRAMDADENSVRLCCKRSKEGVLSGYVATAEQLRMLERYIFRLLGDMVDEIASGDVSANPYYRGERDNACQYCPYAAICHTERVTGRRTYRTMEAEAFWEDVERRLARNGG